MSLLRAAKVRRLAKLPSPCEANAMAVKQKKVRKILTNKIRQMYDIIADIDTLLTEMETDFFRVCIFGSARIDPQSPVYAQVESLAEALAAAGCDIVTGGGPGLMEAANKGAQKGAQKMQHQRKGSGSWSIGLHIDLPFEASTNQHLDLKSQHKRFSSRLDEFMRISHAVVVVPGGIGTLLELFYTWQLIQVEHIKPRPVLLYAPDDFWRTFLRWLERWPLKQELMSDKDFVKLKQVNSPLQMIKELRPHIEAFYKKGRRAGIEAADET